MKLPRSFEVRMLQRLGTEYDAFLEALESKPPVSIRLNPAKPTELYPEAQSVPWCTYGRYLDQRPAFVWDPLYHAGAYYAQEASSMLFGTAVDFSRDLKVLDLCAAPGGKSSLLLSFLSPDSLLISNELVSKRTNILYENLVKWGGANTIITQNRATDFLFLRQYFDVVLVDAPCSGEGMFRKDPGAVEQWSDGLVGQCSRIQKEILDTAVQLVAKGGLLIFSTCTFEEDENEDNLRWLYDRFGSILSPEELPVQPDWGMQTVEVPVSDGRVQKGYYCFPHKVKGEGLFVSAIRVTGGGRTQAQSAKSLNTLTRKQADLISPYAELDSDRFIYGTVGEQIAAIPEALADDMAWLLPKLRVRKAGTALGALQRDTFIPAHEMVMSGMVAAEIPRIELGLEAALDYLQRKPVIVSEDAPRGWIVFTYKGLELGWAKNLGSRVNMHYPAEWRIRKEPKFEER